MNPRPYDPEEWNFNAFSFWAVWHCDKDACPVCLAHAGQYEPTTEPKLPPEGCTCAGGCKCWYENLPIYGPPGERVYGAAPWYETARITPPTAGSRISVWMETADGQFLRGTYAESACDAGDVRGYWRDDAGNLTAPPVQWMVRKPADFRNDS